MIETFKAFAGLAVEEEMKILAAIVSK